MRSSNPWRQMRFNRLRRRQFITFLGAVTVFTLPLGARAQQPAMPVIGYLSSESRESDGFRLPPFWQGLNETGYVERNVAVEYRWADQQNDRLPVLSADLVRRQVAVIVTLGSVPAARAAKATTTTIPIVFEIGNDPVRVGLVASLNRPGGNVTGVSTLNVEIGPKRFELLHELVPATTTIALLVNPTNPNAETLSRDLQAAARTLGLQLHILHASTNSEIDEAFGSLAKLQAGGLVIGPDPFFNTRKDQLSALTLRRAVPTIYNNREFVAAGGLMSYGPSITDAYRQAGIYTGRILKGEKPADLPVMQPTKFELVINLKTAKALGLEIPPKLLALADEVIE
jgi:putative tryptophan/tyrosine transport system substrate-binding protein